MRWEVVEAPTSDIALPGQRVRLNCSILGFSIGQPFRVVQVMRDYMQVYSIYEVEVEWSDIHIRPMSAERHWLAACYFDTVY